MLNREQKEKKDLINAIKVLDVELNKKIERKEELLRSEKNNTSNSQKDRRNKFCY